MKSLLAGAICTSLVALTACNNATDDSAKVADSNAKAPTTVHKEVKKTLTSGIIKSNFDESIRPQDNFYAYVNGGWLKSAEMPADKTSIGAFYDLRDNSDEQVKVIIDDVSKQENLVKGSNEQKVGDLYRSFMNTENLDALGTKPIQPLLEMVTAVKSKDDLATLFAQGEIIGISSPLAFYISIDAKDSTKYATHIWQNGLGLPDKDYYFNHGERFKKIRAAYVEHIEKMFSLAGLKDGKQAAKKLMAL